MSIFFVDKNHVRTIAHIFNYKEDVCH